MVDEFGGRDALASFVHGALVATFQRGVAVVVEEPTSRVAALVAGLAANDIQDEGVARDFLIHLDFDDVSALDAGPVRDYELAGSFGKDETLNWLAVHVVGRLFELPVGQCVHQARCYHTDGCRGDDVRVLGDGRRVGQNLEKEVAEENHVVCLHHEIIDEPKGAESALFKFITLRDLNLELTS